MKIIGWRGRWSDQFHLIPVMFRDSGGLYIFWGYKAWVIRK